LIILGIILIATGCGSSGPSGPSPIMVDENNTGSTVELHTGGRLKVILEGNPSTGYTWEVATVDPSILRQDCEPEFEPESNLIGASGKITMTFKAVSAGPTTLRLIYHRPWETDVPPLKTFEVAVVVRP